MTRLVRLKITPESKRNRVVQLSPDTFEVYLKAKPERNLANTLLIQALAEYFNLPTVAFKILTGHHTHHKLVEITDSLYT